jgi:hypothetical protein
VLAYARHARSLLGTTATRLDGQVAAAVGYTPPASAGASDGMFWMEFKDFIKHYKDLTFCCA